MREHMLSTLCHGQRVPLCGSNEAEIGSDASSETIAKEIGAQDAIVCDMASEQTSTKVKQFCNMIGTTL